MKSCTNCGKTVYAFAKIGETCPHCGARWSFEREGKAKSGKSGCSFWTILSLLIIIIPIIFVGVSRKKRLAKTNQGNEQQIFEQVPGLESYSRKFPESYIIANQSNVISEITEATISENSQESITDNYMPNFILFAGKNLKVIIPLESIYEIVKISPNYNNMQGEMHKVSYLINKRKKNFIGNLTTNPSNITGKTNMGDFKGNFSIDLYNLKYLQRDTMFVNNYNPASADSAYGALFYTNDNDTIKLGNMAFSSTTKGKIYAYILSDENTSLEIPFREIQRITLIRNKKGQGPQTQVELECKNGKKASTNGVVYSYEGFTGVSEYGYCKINMDQIIKVEF